MITCLIDADIVAYRAAASCEKVIDKEVALVEPPSIAIARVHRTMTEILSANKTDSYKAYLSGDNNFRLEINPEYKANRRDLRRPEYLNDCKEYLVTKWGAHVTDGYEADDALGINQTDTTVICSIDKDLLMIPGKYYNFVKDEFSEVSDTEGLRAFYRQTLVGDSTDNIFGIKGIGPVKAAKAINHLQTELEMFEQVSQFYADDMERFWNNADCLWIMQHEGEKYSDRAFVKTLCG